MKKAKIMMAVISIFTLVSGVLAFRAKSVQNVFYTTGLTKIGTKIYTTGCIVPVLLNYEVNPVATTKISYSSAFNSTAVSCVVHVISNE